MSQRSPCTFCLDTVLRTHSSWDYHHLSYLSLRASALRQCVFCSLLFEDVQQHRSHLEHFISSDPSEEQIVRQWLHGDGKVMGKTGLTPETPVSLHRWSVRSLGRTREGKAMVAVTFRVVPRVLVNRDHQQPQEEADTFELPERVFYCFSESDLGPILTPADLGASTNPGANDGYQIKRWIRECGINHNNCPKRAGAGSKWVPTRLLHIGGKREGKTIRVVDTKLANTKGPYVTLSHCWGSSPEQRKDTLTAQNLLEFTTVGVPWSFLSKTFKQAIEIARFLEVDYIWIDSLCIIQGDAADWSHEGNLMHKVYRNSYCNIAAADAANSKEGLFRKRGPQDVIPARFESVGASPMFGTQKWRILREDLWKYDLLSRPLYKRGWVFQERMLAPRILHFGQRQIFWDCAEMSACESLPEGLPLPLDHLAAMDRHWRGRLQEGVSKQTFMLSAVNDDSIEDFWASAVENYTSLDLTKQFDKRLAIWGIAKLVRDSLEEDYAVGMWGSHLEEQLAWKVVDPALSRRPDDLRHNPSWSWISVNGKISVQSRAGWRDRLYRVANHKGQPLSFELRKEIRRPKVPRQPSGDNREEIANMGRDLELVDERRRKSSASSRHGSQVGSFMSRHNSQVGTRRTNLGTGELFEYEKLTSPPTLQKAWSWKAVEYDVKVSRTSERSASDLLSAHFTSMLVLVHQFAMWLWCLLGHSLLALLLFSTRTQPTIVQEKSPFVRRTVADPKDVEPALSKNTIAVQGYILKGKLQWSKDLGRYMILIAEAPHSREQSTIIEAYPDTLEDMETEDVCFLLLTLSQKFEQLWSLGFSSAPARERKTWYEGHGIMLRPSGTDQTYLRTGALQVRYLNPASWRRIRSLDSKQDDSLPDTSNSEGEKFWIT